ncbi:uncharacterized protein LOC114170687 isoform X1 [Vigna unguiculata]|uniref:uncharacterized protein LOC114170687 isoform X1 n=1 Tax=Vigna unguiculata TaxID=3917 RepID=UPI001015D598|nr:uncharacterized protein LOC114170687 isoform X1 [Vigna unguiculata]
MASAFPWLTVRWSNSVQMHGDCSSLLQELAVVAAGLEAAALSACCRWLLQVLLRCCSRGSGAAGELQVHGNGDAVVQKVGARRGASSSRCTSMVDGMVKVMKMVQV